MGLPDLSSSTTLVGEAVLDPDVLVDSLVDDVIDGLRGELHPIFGVRAHRVYRVIRTWSGARPGDGAATDVVKELDPQPSIAAWDGLSITQGRCGLEEAGNVVLSEVSLSYTYDQLSRRGTLADNQMLFYVVGEAHGQGQPSIAFVLDKPPYVDRTKDLGWKIWLRKVAV